ncbi:hypothetical protein KJ937_00160, partial [Patescibacteria group bacterium]|nr:hypothetical protein [Patescibacteria group bacterium]MBU2509671.1 hypothetical protein [Patescibacteria group bacterium]
NPFANDAYDLGLFGAAWKDIYASGTAYVQDDVIIGGLSVCLSDGTNCLAGGGGSQWSYNGTGDFVRPNTNTTSLILGASATANAPFWFKIESTSTRLYLGANGSSTNVVLGNTTASPAIPMHSSFQLDGNDLYVEGNIGSASSVYTNGTFIAGTDNGGSDNFTTYGHGFLTEGTGDYLINAKLGDITLDPVVGSNGTTTIGVETTDRFVLNGVVASDFSPYSDGGYDLGSGSNRWNAFLYNASSVNFEVTGGINSNLNPLANDVYYLGSSSKKWRGLEAINVTTTYLDFTSATGTNLEFTNASGTQLIFEEAYGSDLIVTDNYIYNDWGDRTPGYGAGKFLRAYARDQWYPAFGVMGMVTNTLAVEADIPSLNTIPFAAQDVSTAGGFFVSGSNPDLGTTGQAGMLALHLTSSTRGAAIMGARRCSGDGSNILQLATHEDISRFTVRCDGSVHADKAYDSGGGDYAEFFYTTDTSLGLGEAVALSLGSATSVKRAESADRPYTIGVISSNPAVVGNAGNDSANRENPNFKIVGLMGQVDVLVSTNGGSIQVGDLLMVGNSGFAVKAAGVGMILGQALENLSTTGTIKAYIDPRWSADGIFEAMTSGTRIGNARTAFSTGPEYDSYGLAFQGSAWSTDNVEYISSSFNIFNDAISASSSIFTVQGTTGTNLLTISDIGDMSVKGDLTVGRRLFLGNKTTGAGSTSTYIFVDDTLAPATTYISTNADGWTASTAYDYAEMFFSDEVLKPGDVVTTDPNGVDKIKRTSAPHESVIGIVSTKPGFITGARTTGTHPIALAGRVPTRISTANGVIKAGDQLAISSIPGVAVKAVSSGPIVGVALESYDLPGEGLISVFVQPGWKGGEIIESGSDASDIAYSVEYSTGISPRSGLAKIYAGSNEVQVSFDSLNSYPLITVTPYGQTAAGWWLSNVTDRGFSIIVGEAPMFDLTLAWKAEPSPEGGIMSLSDGTFAPYDPLSGQVFAPEQSDPATEPDPLPPEETVSSTEVVADPLPEEVASAPESSTSTSS